MGGSKTYSIRSVSSSGSGYSGQAINQTVNEISSSIFSNIPDKVIASTLGAMVSAVFVPQLNTLVYALKFVKLAYDMYQAGEKAYNETGDENEALLAAGEVVLGRVVNTVKKECIGIAISYALGENENIKMGDASRTIMVDSISYALEEALK